LPTIRDCLGECQDGTAIIEESDGTWKDSEGFKAMLSNRYQRATAQASLKEKAGDNYETTEVIYFGATVLHRRIPFGDARSTVDAPHRDFGSISLQQNVSRQALST
jgi:hypothetical protein